MSYVRSACEISKWDLESNKRVYESSGISATSLWGGWVVDEWHCRMMVWTYDRDGWLWICEKNVWVVLKEGVWRGDSQWNGSTESMNIGERNWGDRLGTKGARKCLNREDWRYFYHGHPSGGSSWEGSRHPRFKIYIDRPFRCFPFLVSWYNML